MSPVASSWVCALSNPQRILCTCEGPWVNVLLSFKGHPTASPELRGVSFLPKPRLDLPKLGVARLEGESFLV